MKLLGFLPGYRCFCDRPCRLLRNLKVSEMRGACSCPWTGRLEIFRNRKNTKVQSFSTAIFHTSTVFQTSQFAAGKTGTVSGASWGPKSWCSTSGASLLRHCPAKLACERFQSVLKILPCHSIIEDGKIPREKKITLHQAARTFRCFVANSRPRQSKRPSFALTKSGTGQQCIHKKLKTYQKSWTHSSVFGGLSKNSVVFLSPIGWQMKTRKGKLAVSAIKLPSFRKTTPQLHPKLKPHHSVTHDRMSP
ncbi:hypothetical protein HDK77DRAFT_207936 [Phyllosticta capitalensis]